MRCKMKDTIYTQTQNAYTETGFFIINTVFNKTIMIPTSCVHEWEELNGELTPGKYKQFLIDYFGIPHGFTALEPNQR